MKTTHFLTYLCSCIMLCTAAFLTSGCSSDDEDDSTHKVSIEVSSTSIKQGAVVDASEVKTITISYNKAVVLAADADIILKDSQSTAGVEVEAESSKQNPKDIIVKVTLESGKNYTLTIPEGDVVNAADETDAAGADFILKFSTKKS